MSQAVILSADQIAALRAALSGRLIALSFGAGVDSTALLVVLYLAGIRPDVITFADTDGEKPESLAHIVKINAVLASWGWPLISVCKKVPLATTGYTDLYGNCMANETLPSLAFGLKSCSIKWKQLPQDQFIKGAKRGPNACPPHPIWTEYQATGKRIVKLIGYDAGRADMRRSKNLPAADADFDYAYPLQVIGWARPDCVAAITAHLGADLVPIKSACYFCPASKHWELFWLAAHHPELLERALILERRALTGRHSRFDSVEFGASWEDLVRDADSFPSSSTTVGLGRSFSWNQWARVNNVVDSEFNVLRTDDARARFAITADLLRGKGEDNAQDSRSRPCENRDAPDPLEIGLAAKRFLGFGWEVSDIAKRLSIPETHVDDLLMLMESPKALRDMVQRGQVSASTAIEQLHKHGTKAVTVLQSKPVRAEVIPIGPAEQLQTL